MASGVQKLQAPLRRSLLLRAGLIVAVLSGLAWWHSTRYLTSLRCGDFAVMNAASRVSCGWIQNPGTWLELRQTSLLSYEPSERIRWGPPQWVREKPITLASGPPRKCGGNIKLTLDETLFISAVPGNWQLFVPHWIPFVASALPCLCAVLYRAEKRPRTRKSGAPA